MGERGSGTAKREGLSIYPLLRLFALVVFATWLMTVVRSTYLGMGQGMAFGGEVVVTLVSGAVFGLVSTLLYRANRGWKFRKEFIAAFCVGFAPVFLWVGLIYGLLAGNWIRHPTSVFWSLEISMVAGLGVALGHLADRQFRR